MSESPQTAPGAEPTPEPRARRLRARMLTVIGAAALTTPGCWWSNCPEPEPEVVTGTLTLDSQDEACPTDPAVGELRYGDVGPDTGLDSDPDTGLPWTLDHYDSCEAPVLQSQEDLTCVYEVACTPWTCCGYGRPYLDGEGRAVAAGVRADPAWSHPGGMDVDALSEADRAQLRDFWLKSAASEHSSVAGFHRFALDLMAHGAPPELVRRAGEAAAQEIRHAVDCFSLASVYGGERYGPEALDLGGSAPVASSLVELAAWTVRDGAVGETLAAYLAAESLARATEPEVRRALEVVVRDETRHAELAWETLAWALEVGGAPVAEAIRLVFDTLPDPDSPPERSTPATVAHGLLPAEARDAAVRRCIDEVLRPVMAELLRGRAAA